MPKKYLNIKYNIPNIKLFLAIFDLNLEEKDNYDKIQNQSLAVYMDNLEVGKVTFTEEDIKIDTLSIYGKLNCITNYATAFTLTDPESIQTIGKLGLFASWDNTFSFHLNFFNKTSLSGNLMFCIQIDNEFGNTVSPHFKLQYKDNEKEYNIKFQENGKNFDFIEKRGDFQEEIFYNLFDYFGGPYIYHSKSDKFRDKEKTYAYDETSLIAENTVDGKKRNTAIRFKKFNDNYISYSSTEFSRISKNDSKEEVVNKVNYMNLIDPTLNEKILRLLEEFSINGNSILERLFLYAFHHYTNEEMYALFKINKKDINLENFYFEKMKAKTLKKIFH